MDLLLRGVPRTFLFPGMVSELQLHSTDFSRNSQFLENRVRGSYASTPPCRNKLGGVTDDRFSCVKFNPPVVQAERIESGDGGYHRSA